MRTLDVTVFLLVVLVACCSAMKLDLQSLLRHREMYAPTHKRAKDGKEAILFVVFSWGQHYTEKENSTQNKSQTQRARAYDVTSCLSTGCELSTKPCSKNVCSLGPWSLRNTGFFL